MESSPPPGRCQNLRGHDEKTRWQFGKTHAAYTTRFMPSQVGMIWRFRGSGKSSGDLVAGFSRQPDRLRNTVQLNGEPVELRVRFRPAPQY